MRLSISVLVISVAMLIVQRAAAQDTSTSEERAQWVEITHKLESAPLDDSVNKQGEAAFKRLSDVHDVHVLLCPALLTEFNGMKYAYSHTITRLARKLITIPKSKNGNTRHIPLNSVALASFQVLFKRSSGEGRVFVSIHAEPLKGYKHWFDRAAKEAGVTDFTWYCLRHTFASRLVMHGVDLRTVAELMGHKTIQMTMRYAHLAPAHKQAAVECLTNAWHSEKPTDTRTDTSAKQQLDGSMADAKQVM
ncbi:MAG: site-specific integrase [Candidatus Sulfotelmatobacter sp.]|jgi:hypothetical protein